MLFESYRTVFNKFKCRKVKCMALVNSRLSRQAYALYATAVYALMVDPVFPSDEQIQLSS